MWTTDPYTGAQAAELDELILVATPPPFGTLRPYPATWQVQAFTADRHIATILAAGDADTVELAQAAALSAATTLR